MALSLSLVSLSFTGPAIAAMRPALATRAVHAPSMMLDSTFQLLADAILLPDAAPAVAAAAPAAAAAAEPGWFD